MKRNITIWLSCVSLAFLQLQPCCGETYEDPYKRLGLIKVHKFHYKAANIYDAINHTMTLAIAQDPSLENISIIIGPMKPRNDEKPEEQDITIDETASNILRYWSELFYLHLKVRENTIIFDEIRTQP